jgi:uncharacterized protein (DUF1778 family)
MMIRRQKLKTALIQLRVEPGLKALAQKGAQKEHRTLTSWIEVLILTRAKELNVDATAPESKETNA